MADHSDLSLAADRFFPGGTISPVIGGRRLIRVESESGVAVVRQWPAETTRDHVEFVHAVHATVRAADLAFVAPMLPLAGGQESVLALNGRLYDARPWLPGEPLGRTEVNETSGELVELPTVVSQAALVATIAAIARFHEASMALARHDQRMTIRQLRQATRQLWQVYRERLRPAAPSYPAIQHWLRTGERALPMALLVLDQEPELAQATNVVGHHRLWPAYVLRQESGERSLESMSEGDERWPMGTPAAARNDKGGTAAISGLVGLSDPAWGSPLLDLAQITTRFARWSPELIEALIGTYSGIRRLGPAERRMLPAVATLDLMVQAGRLLDVAYGPPMTAPPPAASSPLVVAAEAMVTSLEAVSESLTDLTPHERPQGTRWRRGPRPALRSAKRRPGRSGQRRDHLT